MPTYKYDENGDFMPDKFPSYTDRVFYSFSKQLLEDNKIKVSSYESIHVPELMSDHRGV